MEQERLKKLPKVVDFLNKRKDVIIMSANPEFSIIEKEKFKPKKNMKITF